MHTIQHLIDEPIQQLLTMLRALTDPSDAFFRIALFPGFLSIGLIATLIVWIERKFVAKIQLRIGPYYASPGEGILQTFADFIKLVFKEPITPRKADKLFFRGAPLVAVVLAAGIISVIPFTEQLVIANLDIGLIFLFAAVSIFPSLILIAGWASNSKYPFIGGIRALFQQVAYEIPLWISAMGVVILAGSLNLIEIVKAQANLWFILPQLLGAAIFFIAVVAELERIPFDLPEAEPELVMGWMTEYSGILFGMCFFSLYIKLYAFSALLSVMYLGGWLGPAILPPLAWFLIKTFAVMMVILALRATFPRVRIDLLLRQGWTTLLGLAVVNVFLTVGLVQAGIVA